MPPTVKPREALLFSRKEAVGASREAVRGGAPRHLWGMALRFRLWQHLALDFFDEERQIGTGETQVGRRDTVMFDVR